MGVKNDRKATQDNLLETDGSLTSFQFLLRFQLVVQSTACTPMTRITCRTKGLPYPIDDITESGKEHNDQDNVLPHTDLLSISDRRV